jgi:NAD(P)H-flavin reductase
MTSAPTADLDVPVVIAQHSLSVGEALAGHEEAVGGQGDGGGTDAQVAAGSLSGDIPTRRQWIDDIDSAISELVNKRMVISREIQTIRTSTGAARLELARERDVIAGYERALGSAGSVLALTMLEICRGASPVVRASLTAAPSHEGPSAPAEIRIPRQRRSSESDREPFAPHISSVEVSGAARQTATEVSLAPVVERHPKHAAASPVRARRHYYTLALVVTVVDAVATIVARPDGGWHAADGSAVRVFSALALANFVVAVLFRQTAVVNTLFNLAAAMPRRFPHRLLRTASRVYTIGGIHVGAAAAGTAFFLAALAYQLDSYVRGLAAPTTWMLGVSIAAGVLLIVIVGCAMPTIRYRRHKLFEFTHRFGGWLAVALLWVLTAQTLSQRAGGSSRLSIWLQSPRLWAVMVITLSIALPWLRLRRVEISVDRPSSHVAIVKVRGPRAPRVGSTLAVSRTPLGEWHSFACFGDAREHQVTILVSRAGDWTARFIDDPPRHLWVRGIPAAALARIEVLHKRLVYVCTGSGIGPMLGQILARQVPATLVWSTRSPRRTYGEAIVDQIIEAIPSATIWDTTEQGTADVPELAIRAAQSFQADAALVVSNQATTWRVAEALERAGVPAFGPIWDS